MILDMFHPLVMNDLGVKLPPGTKDNKQTLERVPVKFQSSTQTLLILKTRLCLVRFDTFYFLSFGVIGTSDSRFPSARRERQTRDVRRTPVPIRLTKSPF